MGPLGGCKDTSEVATKRPDYLEEFLARPADIDVIKAIATADADRAAEEARIAANAKSEFAFDPCAPRPPVIEIDF
ncbi:MAG: hypothetical protein WCF25_08610 [Acidimicrobiales bacterium]